MRTRINWRMRRRVAGEWKGDKEEGEGDVVISDPALGL